MDSGSRRFIAVQLPENVPITSEAYSAGFGTICEIALKRLELAGNEISKSSPETDVGFRVLKLDSSNMNPVYYNPNEMKKDFLAYSENNIKSDRTGEDLLFQVMIELGIDLSSIISKSEICGKEVFDVDNTYLIACFDENITDDIVTEIAKKQPIHVVIRDSSLASDSVAINFEQIFKTYSPNTRIRVL